MSKKMILAGALSSILTIGFTQQQPDSVEQSKTLKEVVVTSSKIPLPERETAKPVQIIEREEIERSHGKDLSQLLNEQTGIIINGAYSNPGKNKDIFLRGAASEYTLILLDGIPLDDASSVGGAFDLRMLPLAQIERIEILKGSQSTLYGSDAIAGVINIITRKSGDKPIGMDGVVSAGSLGTVEASGALKGKANIFDYNLIYNHQNTDGISEAIDNNDTIDFDKDGFSRNSFHANIGLEPLQTLQISPFVRYTDFEGDFDAGSFSDADNNFTMELINPGLKAKYEEEKFTINGLYNYAQTNRFFTSAFGESEFKGRTHTLDIFSSLEIDENFRLLTGLFNQSAKVIDDQGLEINPDDNLFSPYITFLISDLSGLNLELGYRFNQHSEFGGHSTFSVAPSYRIMENLNLFAAYTTGFKSPTLSQLFGRFGPNPELEPQTSRSIEAGGQLSLLDNLIQTEVVYFDRKIEDVIVFDFNTGFFNQDEQSDHGIEVNSRFSLTEEFSVKVGYTFLDGEVATVNENEQDTTFFNLIRRPKHSLNAFLQLTPVPRGFVSFHVQYFGDRTDAFFNPENGFQREDVALDSYVLLNAYAEYEILKSHLILFADLKNLTDTDYQESFGFSTIGFNIQSGLRFNL